MSGTNPAAVPGLAIRFDGPPSHESGRFVEVEIDGVSVKVGEWKQQGDFWLLVLGPTYAAAPDLLAALKILLNRYETLCFTGRVSRDNETAKIAAVAIEKATVRA